MYISNIIVEVLEHICKFPDITLIKRWGLCPFFFNLVTSLYPIESNRSYNLWLLNMLLGCLFWKRQPLSKKSGHLEIVRLGRPYFGAQIDSPRWALSRQSALTPPHPYQACETLWVSAVPVNIWVQLCKRLQAGIAQVSHSWKL